MKLFLSVRLKIPLKAVKKKIKRALLEVAGQMRMKSDSGKSALFSEERKVNKE